MLTCDNHPEREAWNCSGWAVRRYLCEECRGAMKSQPRPSRREWWIENEPMCGWNDENHAYHNPNAIYSRSLASNKDIINDK